MTKSAIVFILAAANAAIAVWRFVDDIGGFQSGTVSSYEFAQHVIPPATISIISVFFALRIRAREAGEA